MLFSTLFLALLAICVNCTPETTIREPRAATNAITCPKSSFEILEKDNLQDVCILRTKLQTGLTYQQAKDQCEKEGGTLPLYQSFAPNELVSNQVCKGVAGSLWLYIVDKDRVSERLLDTNTCLAMSCGNKKKFPQRCTDKVMNLLCFNVSSRANCTMQKNEANQDVCAYAGEQFGPKQYTYLYRCGDRCSAAVGMKAVTGLILVMLIVGKLM